MNLPKASKTIIISDENVQELYGDLLKDQLGAELISIPAGEASKSREMKAQVEDQLFELGCDRDTLLIALGGGVVGDLTGFIAATYMRGIRYIQMPTTLLSMVDSSIGGKTGINTKHGKNLIGAFWHPESIHVDPRYLQTLSQQHLINGLIEAVKVFLTHDKESFHYCEEHLEEILNKDETVLAHVIEKARAIKLGVVERDEREKGERMLLNFGHSIGHALEKLSSYELLHGNAVALGILIESKMAHAEEKLSEEDLIELTHFFSRLDFTLDQVKVSADQIWEAMANDKKNKDGQIRYIVLEEIGRARLAEPLNRDTLISVLNT